MIPILSRDQVQALACQLLDDARTRSITIRGAIVGDQLAEALWMAGLTEDEGERLIERLDELRTARGGGMIGRRPPPH